MRQLHLSTRTKVSFHAPTLMSSVVAFLCLGACLLVLTNVERVTSSLGAPERFTVYATEDSAALYQKLSENPHVRSVSRRTSRELREQLIRHTGLSDLHQITSDMFPTAYDIGLRPMGAEARGVLKTQLLSLSGVTHVDFQTTQFSQWQTLLRGTRVIVAVLALLILLCVVSVVANAVLLSLARRRREVEVARVCGATDAFIRRPFVFEGALQGAGAAVLAVVLLGLTYLYLREALATLLSFSANVQPQFLGLPAIVALLLGGAALGGTASLFSVRTFSRS